MKKTSCYLFLLLILISACNRHKNAITRTDTSTSGEAMIVSDECFAPIIEEEIAVFTGLNIEAFITPVYTSEIGAFKLFMEDSIRTLIATRELTLAEKEHIKSMKLTLRSQKIAIDGIALIIHPDNKDSLISLSTIQKIILGEYKDWNDFAQTKSATPRPLTVIFDNPNSSTVRFIRDSICKGQAMSNELVAADSNRAVIDYIASHPDAIGIIGVNWISNIKDTNQLDFINTIQTMAVSREDIPTYGNSYKPYPAYFANGDYPLTRDVYIHLTDVRGGLPAGFVAFIAGDSGQRIILKAGLVPATRPTRLINIQENF